MKRRIGLRSVAALLACVGIFVPSPASANHGHCAGTGTAKLDEGLGLPGSAPVTANFEFGLTIGTCDNLDASVEAEGTVTGVCGLSTGEGTINDEADFDFVSQGTVLVFVGGATGVASVVEDPFDVGSCTNGTAVYFLVTGFASSM